MPIIYPFTTRSLAVPFLPRPTTVKDQEVSRWGSDLTLAVSRAFDALATRIEELTITSGDDGIGEAPAPVHTRNFFYDEPLGDLYLDTGAWTLISSLKAADHTVDTTLFGGILTANEDTAQKAFDKIDDHSHPYIPLIPNFVANHFPYQSINGTLINSGYDAADFAAAGHSHSYLPLSGGEISGIVYFDNGVPLCGYDTSDGGHNLASVNSSDEVDLGSAFLDLNLLGVQFSTIPPLGNTVYLKGKTPSATPRNLIGVDSGSQINVGDSNLGMKLVGSTVKWGDTAGGNYGDLQTDGDLIQTGTAKIETAASVAAAHTWSSDLQATKLRTFGNNSSQNFFKWGSGAATGDSCHFRIEFSIQVVYTYSGSTYYWTRGGTLTGTILKLSSSLCKAIANTVAWDGAGIAFTDTGTANTPSMGELVAMTTSVAAADMGPYFKVDLTGAGYTFESAECRWTVISTDTDHTAWTGNFV